MRRRAAILVIALWMVIGGPQPAFACTCPPTSPRSAGGNATLVFTGVVTRVSGAMPLGFSCLSTTRSTADPLSVEFDVETVYKGDVGRRIVVQTAEGGASCGYAFEQGKRYTVFPWQVDGKLNAGLCHGNVEGTIVASEYGLPEGHAPRN